MNEVLIIIPAYNEEKTITKTVESILNTKYDYIIINDGSTDSTQKILEQHNYNHIDLLTNLGIGGAVQTGYKYAHDNNYDIAVQFDADGQHDPEYIESLMNEKFELFMGDDLQGRKDFIAENGYKYLDDVDLS